METCMRRTCLPAEGIYCIIQETVSSSFPEARSIAAKCVTYKMRTNQSGLRAVGKQLRLVSQSETQENQITASKRRQADDAARVLHECKTWRGWQRISAAAYWWHRSDSAVGRFRNNQWPGLDLENIQISCSNKTGQKLRFQEVEIQAERKGTNVHHMKMYPFQSSQSATTFSLKSRLVTSGPVCLFWRCAELFEHSWQSSSLENWEGVSGIPGLGSDDGRPREGWSARSAAAQALFKQPSPLVFNTLSWSWKSLGTENLQNAIIDSGSSDEHNEQWFLYWCFIFNIVFVFCPKFVWRRCLAGTKTEFSSSDLTISPETLDKTATRQTKSWVLISESCR